MKIELENLRLREKMAKDEVYKLKDTMHKEKEALLARLTALQEQMDGKMESDDYSAFMRQQATRLETELSEVASCQNPCFRVTPAHLTLKRC